jgi:RNA polymerase sigma-70 factor (ECF subfamily)
MPRQHHPTETSSSSSSPAAELSAGFERDVVSMRGALYRHAYRLSQNHQDVEDLVQETMMKAYGAFHTFRVDTNLTAWVFRILTNTYINSYRQKRRRPVQYSTDDVTDQHLAEVYTHYTPVGLRSAEDQALVAGHRHQGGDGGTSCAVSRGGVLRRRRRAPL